jgi:hypothetical protein
MSFTVFDLSMNNSPSNISLSIRDAYSQIFLSGGGAYPRDFYKLSNKNGLPKNLWVI